MRITVCIAGKGRTYCVPFTGINGRTICEQWTHNMQHRTHIIRSNGRTICEQWTHILCVPITITTTDYNKTSITTSGRIDNTLLCELAAHPDFPRLMADLEIYVNGTALKQAQGANAIVDTMSATVIKKHNPGMSDTQLRQLITAHIDEDEFCRYVIQRDINGIALALRETHKDDFFSVPEDNPLKEMLETAGEIVSQDSDTEQAYLAFICKRLKLNFRKLSVEERKWLKKIAEKSDLLKNPKPQRGRR